MVSIVETLAGNLQTNIFAIKKIESELDSVQSRLASGQRVTTALDNPTNFFLASAFSSRASRLSSVLDGITARLSTLQQASESLTSLTDLTQQVKDVAESAEQTLIDNPSEASITGNRNLSSFTDLPTDLSGVDAGDQLIFRFLDTTGSFATNTVVINAGNSTNDVITNINAIVNSGASQVFEATLNGSGQLSVKTQDNSRFEIDFQDNLGNADTQLVSALGFGDFVTNEQNNNVSATRITLSPTPALTTTTLFDRSTGNQASSSTLLLNISDTAGGPVGDIFNGDNNDSLALAFNGGTAATIVNDIPTATLQDFIDGINNNGGLNSNIAATFDSGSGTLSIRAIDTDVVSLQFELNEDALGAGVAGKFDLQQFGIGAGVLQSALDGNNTTSSESIQLGPGASSLADLETEFNDLRTQIDDLVDDAELDNINLLNGDNLVTLFSADGSSSLTTTGQTVKALNLGIGEANFANNDTITSLISDIDNGLDTLERFSTSLTNDISVISTREDFTQGTISNLNTGVENLTVADEEADGALFQALQARRTLSITVLGLSSEAQETIFRSF